MATVPKASVTTDANTLTFGFASGETLRASIDVLPSDVVARLALHGLEQKLRDSYAGVSAESAYTQAARVWTTLTGGQWTTRRAAEAAEDPISLLVQAVTTVLAARGDAVPADLATQITAMDRSGRAKLRAVPAVAAELARLRGGSSDVLDSLLGGA